MILTVKKEITIQNELLSKKNDLFSMHKKASLLWEAFLL